MNEHKDPIPPQEEHEFAGAPPPVEKSILTELLDNKPLVEMNDEELNAHLAKLRQTMETPATLRAAMSTKAREKKTGPKGPSKAKTDGIDLLKSLGI